MCKYKTFRKYKKISEERNKLRFTKFENKKLIDQDMNKLRNKQEQNSVSE